MMPGEQSDATFNSVLEQSKEPAYPKSLLLLTPINKIYPIFAMSQPSYEQSNIDINKWIVEPVDNARQVDSENDFIPHQRKKKKPRTRIPDTSKPRSTNISLGGRPIVEVANDTGGTGKVRICFVKPIRASAN
jgi:hypothetical protein